MSCNMLTPKAETMNGSLYGRGRFPSQKNKEMCGILASIGIVRINSQAAFDNREELLWFLHQ